MMHGQITFRIPVPSQCLIFAAVFAFGIAMLNFAGCGEGSQPKECSGTAGTVSCEEFFCGRTRTGGVANKRDTRNEHAMRLTFSMNEKGAWKCDQNGQPLVSTEFVSFVWRQYAAFARSQAECNGKNLHFILTFPPSMPCGLHHFTLSAFEVMGVPIAYAEYPVGDATNYTIVSSQLDNPEFPDMRAFIEKSADTLHRMSTSKGILIRMFKRSASDSEAYLREFGLPRPATNVRDFIEILTKDKEEGVFTINSFSGIITFESPVDCKPQGVFEVDAALRQPH